VIKASIAAQPTIDPPAEPTEETTARHAEYRVTPPTPSMKGHPVVAVAGDRLTLGRWHGRSDVAYLAIPPGARMPQPSGVEAALDRLRNQGVRSAFTAALRDHEALAFLSSGFETFEYLHVLRHDLQAVPPLDDTHHLRRARRSDRARVLDIDDAAFDDFWRLDDAGLAEALRATTSVRYRVALDPADERPVGYAVCGRAADTGYLQRLAVDPSHAGTGLGAALVTDALQWLRRRHARSALVNTQTDNLRALRLYRRLGFVEEPHHRLTVLRWDA